MTVTLGGGNSLISISVAPSVLTLTVPLAGSYSPGLIEMSRSSVRFPLGASLSSWALVPIELIKSKPSPKPKTRTTYIPCMNISDNEDGLNLSLIIY
jgi:hypothetical protein